MRKNRALSAQNTPRELKIRLRLPDESEPVIFKIPTRRLEEIPPEELTNESMFIFAPYFSMLYEDKLKKNPAELKNLEKNILFLIDGINAKVERNEISKRIAEIALSILERILKNVLANSNLNQEEVNKVMENVEQRYVAEPLNWEAKGRAEGLAMGRTEGSRNTQIETAKEMLSDGLGIETVRRYSRLDDETLHQLRATLLEQ